jgi:hypothetical protein
MLMRSPFTKNYNKAIAFFVDLGDRLFREQNYADFNDHGDSLYLNSIKYCLIA